MITNNKLYDALKYAAQVGLPALATFVYTVGPIWDLPKAGEVSATIVAANTLLGALLVVNQVAYKNSDARFDGTIDPYLADAVTSDRALDIPEMKRLVETDASPKVAQKEILLKVEQPDFSDGPIIWKSGRG